MVYVDSSICSKWVEELKMGKENPQLLPPNITNSGEVANDTLESCVDGQEMRRSANDILPPRMTRWDLRFVPATSPLTSDSCEKQRAQREEENWKSGFLRLSPELRNRIYQDTIPTTTRISVVARVDKKQINLLQLCRAIRNETVPIFYGNTTFTFDLRTRPNFQRAKSWLDGLSPEAIASLRKLYVLSDVNCCCKEASKNEKPASLHAWVDVEAGKWSQYGYHGCKCCSSQEGARDVVRKIQHSVTKQNVRREELAELLEIMRPIRAFDFSFEVAKDGEGKATFETRPKLFGQVIAKTDAGKASALVVRGREIKQPRTRRRSGMRVSDMMASLPAVEAQTPEALQEDPSEVGKEELQAKAG
jgi:hypothetical protein